MHFIIGISNNNYHKTTLFIEKKVKLFCQKSLMREIDIKNFRCYESKRMEFRSGVNLLIGDNAVGKTSLLRACNLVINSFFSGYSDENTTWRSAENNDFRITGVAEQPVEIAFRLGEWDLFPLEIPSANVHFIPILNDIYKIEKKSKKNSRNLVSGLNSLKIYASNLQKYSHVLVDGKVKQNHVLPVYGFFSTEDIHSIRKIDKEKFKNLTPKPSFGYYESYDCKGLMDCWIKRLLVLKEAKKGEEEIITVNNAIIDALGPQGCNIIDDMEIRHNDGKVYFHFTDGREIESGMLSDGYRRLVNIVMDIAIRCALLNKTMFGNKCYKETHGTVIIDEIDEHLHPSIQVRILKALQKAFPKIQFIVSTHSPLVISSVESHPYNVVYKLGYDDKTREYTHHELNVYGMDASTIIETYMGQEARDIDVSNNIKEVQSLIDKQKLPEAKAALMALGQKMAQGDPELAKMETLISFLE